MQQAPLLGLVFFLKERESLKVGGDAQWNILI